MSPKVIPLRADVTGHGHTTSRSRRSPRSPRPAHANDPAGRKPPRAAWMLGRVVEALLVLGGCLAGMMCAGGCDNEPIIIRVDSMDADKWEAVYEAEIILEHPIEVQIGGPEYGRVDLTWQQYVEVVDGKLRAGYASPNQIGCFRAAQSHDTGIVLAHELGHAFRIEHRNDEDEIDDLMTPGYIRNPGDGLTFHDRRRFDRNVNNFYRLCTAAGPP